MKPPLSNCQAWLWRGNSDVIPNRQYMDLLLESSPCTCNGPNKKHLMLWLHWPTTA